MDLDDVVETNHISSQTRELCTLQFGNLEAVVLLEPGSPNPIMQERSLSTTFVNRLTITMTSCSETEEEMDEEDSNKENCS